MPEDTFKPVTINFGETINEEIHRILYKAARAKTVAEVRAVREELEGWIYPVMTLGGKDKVDAFFAAQNMRVAGPPAVRRLLAAENRKYLKKYAKHAEG